MAERRAATLPRNPKVCGNSTIGQSTKGKAANAATAASNADRRNLRLMGFEQPSADMMRAPANIAATSCHPFLRNQLFVGQDYTCKSTAAIFLMVNGEFIA